jgi:hypothetical protein
MEMTSRVQNIVGGLAIATVIAVIVMVPSFQGISTWKYVLGVIGLVLFFCGGIGQKR